MDSDDPHDPYFVVGPPGETFGVPNLPIEVSEVRSKQSGGQIIVDEAARVFADWNCVDKRDIRQDLQDLAQKIIEDSHKSSIITLPRSMETVLNVEPGDVVTNMDGCQVGVFLLNVGDKIQTPFGPAVVCRGVDQGKLHLMPLRTA